MTDQPVLLKALLQQRHWQKYGTFCAQYDKAARTIDPHLVRTWPSRGQLHRWLSGGLKGLPYPDHCRVLEAMFPDWTADQLFAPAPNGTTTAPGSANGHQAQPPSVGGSAPVAVPSVAIRPHIERAFEREHVSIDFAGYSGETLHGAIQEPLDKVRVGEFRPRTIRLRLLLPDTASPMAVPCRTDDLSDDPEFRDRIAGIAGRHSQAILDSVSELARLHVIEEATAEIRVHTAAPLFKLYVVNDTEAFFGFYPIREHELTINGAPHSVYDMFGKDALLFHHSSDADSASAAYVAQARTWFDSVWQSISRRELTP